MRLARQYASAATAPGWEAWSGSPDGGPEIRPGDSCN